jgi:hypothetical protein
MGNGITDHRRKKRKWFYFENELRYFFLLDATAFWSPCFSGRADSIVGQPGLDDWGQCYGFLKCFRREKMET